MILSEARTFVRQFARNAADSTMYPDDNIDRAIQTVCNRFVRETKALKKIDTIAIAQGDSTLSVSSITGLRPDLILRMQISGKSEVEIGDYFAIGDKIACGESYSGAPQMIGFKDWTSAIFYPAADAAYTLNIQWAPQFTSFTPGADGTTVLNLPDEWMTEILSTGVPSLLQYTEPEHKYASEGWKRYLDFESRMKSAGSLGARTMARSHI